MAAWRDVEPHSDALKLRLDRGVVFHDQRIVSGHDVLRRIRQPVEQVEPFQHFRNVIDNGERAPLLEIRV